MVSFVIFVCLLIANSSSEYATKSKFLEEPIVENLKNSIDTGISSSNRTDGNSKDIFQKILPTDTLMLTKDVGDKKYWEQVPWWFPAWRPTVRHLENGEKFPGLTVRSHLRLMTKCLGDGFGPPPFGYFLLQHPFSLLDGSLFILIWLSRRYDSTMQPCKIDSENRTYFRFYFQRVSFRSLIVELATILDKTQVWPRKSILYVQISQTWITK